MILSFDLVRTGLGLLEPRGLNRNHATSEAWRKARWTRQRASRAIGTERGSIRMATSRDDEKTAACKAHG
jgi:hypothetical protein